MRCAAHRVFSKTTNSRNTLRAGTLCSKAGTCQLRDRPETLAANGCHLSESKPAHRLFFFVTSRCSTASHTPVRRVSRGSGVASRDRFRRFPPHLASLVPVLLSSLGSRDTFRRAG